MSSFFISAESLIVSKSWTVPVVVDNDYTMTYSGGVVSSLGISIATSGHVNGRTVIIVIPANSLSSDSGLILPSNFNLDGDVFDKTKDYVITITRINNAFFGTKRSLPSADTTIPTLSSATVRYATSNTLELSFNEAVYIPGVSGISLSFSVGTARTVTAISSGNNTTTVYLTLSGAISASDVFTVSIIGSYVQDINGNYLAAVNNTSVSNLVGEPVFTGTFIFLRGDQVTQSGTVSSWTDQSGEGNHFTQSTAGERPTYVASDAAINNKPCVDFDGTDDSLINITLAISGSAPADFTSYTVLWVWKQDGSTNDIIFSFADSTGNEFTGPDLVKETGALTFYCGNNTNGAGAAHVSTSWSYGTAIHRGTSRDLYINNVLFGTNGVSVNPNAIRYGRLGRGVQTGVYPLDGRIAEFRLINRELSGAEISAWNSYVSSRYGL